MWDKCFSKPILRMIVFVKLYEFWTNFQMIALESLSFYAILPIPTDFHTHCKYENNTSPCARWHAMFSQALHKAMGA